jgi:Ubiquitin carboxyl-terminal hydrolase
LVLGLHLKLFDNRGRKLDRKIAYPEAIDLQDFTSNSTPSTYQLYSILVHEGLTAKSGHYFAIAKEFDDTWKIFNDSFVSADQSQYHLKARPYILFYIRKDVPKEERSIPIFNPVQEHKESIIIQTQINEIHQATHNNINKIEQSVLKLSCSLPIHRIKHPHKTIIKYRQLLKFKIRPTYGVVEKWDGGYSDIYCPAKRRVKDETDKQLDMGKLPKKKKKILSQIDYNPFQAFSENKMYIN